MDISEPGAVLRNVKIIALSKTFFVAFIFFGAIIPLCPLFSWLTEIVSFFGKIDAGPVNWTKHGRQVDIVQPKPLKTILNYA